MDFHATAPVELLAIIDGYRLDLETWDMIKASCQLHINVYLTETVESHRFGVMFDSAWLWRATNHLITTLEYEGMTPFHIVSESYSEEAEQEIRDFCRRTAVNEYTLWNDAWIGRIANLWPIKETAKGMVFRATHAVSSMSSTYRKCVQEGKYTAAVSLAFDPGFLVDMPFNMPLVPRNGFAQAVRHQVGNLVREQGALRWKV